MNDCETARSQPRYWQNSKRIGYDVERFNRVDAFLSRVALKKSASVIVIRPPALPYDEPKGAKAAHNARAEGR